MNTVLSNEKMRDRLFMASSYLRVIDDNEVLLRGNLNPYCRVAKEVNEKDIMKSPRVHKKLYHAMRIVFLGHP